MRALLVRVAVDSGPEGGYWNAPVDIEDGRFAYVPIPEPRAVKPGAENPYAPFGLAVARFGASLPWQLVRAAAHLDPDFEHLTYGDGGQRAAQINELGRGDVLVFYAGLKRIVGPRRPLVHAVIGLSAIEETVLAVSVPDERRHENAHTRREPRGDGEIVVRARQGVSGRLEQCIPIGERVGQNYTLMRDVFDAWGGIDPDFIQRSVRLPKIGDPPGFMRWFESQDPVLIATNTDVPHRSSTYAAETPRALPA